MPGERRLSHNELELARQYSETSARVSDAIHRKRKGKDAPADLKKEVDMWEHRLSVEELAAKLGTNVETGLTAEDAKRRLEEDGPNQLTVCTEHCHQNCIDPAVASLIVCVVVGFAT